MSKVTAAAEKLQNKQDRSDKEKIKPICRPWDMSRASKGHFKSLRVVDKLLKVDRNLNIIHRSFFFSVCSEPNFQGRRERVQIKLDHGPISTFWIIICPRDEEAVRLLSVSFKQRSDAIRSASFRSEITIS